MKNPTFIILAFLFGIIIGFMIFQMYINDPIPDGLIDKYTNKYASSTSPTIACPVCVPYAEITGGKLYCDNSLYLSTIKAMNEQIFDLKKCLSEECLNFSSMSSNCK